MLDVLGSRLDTDKVRVRLFTKSERFGFFVHDQISFWDFFLNLKLAISWGWGGPPAAYRDHTPGTHVFRW